MTDRAFDEADPHAPKLSPDDPRVRIKQPRTRRLRKGRLIAALSCVAFVVASGLAYATSSTPKKKNKQQESATAQAVVPEAILRGPQIAPIAPPPTPRVEPAPTPPPTALQLPDESAEARESARAAHRDDPYSPEALRRKRVEAFWAARGGGVLVELNAMPEDPGARDGVVPDEMPTDAEGIAELTHRNTSASVGNPLDAQGLADGDANLQGRKNDFLSAVGRGSGDGYLHARLQRPRSPYEVKAGAIIPAVLQTGINSDLPGPVFAKVREDVYDSITHEYLLIPQNSTLVAAYDSMVAWGQERVLLCWQRLILPNGSSIQLECQPGADLAGAAGLTDSVDEHWWRIIKGAAVASLISAATTAAAGNTTGYNPTVPQLWARGAASEIGNAGESITRRNIMIQPTITVRPGWSLNVMVTKDMILEPYNATP